VCGDEKVRRDTGHDISARMSGEVRRDDVRTGEIGPYARGIRERLHLHFRAILRKAGVLEAELAVIDSVLVRAFGGGDATGPSPVDRRKLGSKHTLLVDAKRRAARDPHRPSERQRLQTDSARGRGLSRDRR